MRPDVSELREFYDGRLGRLARRLINRRILSLWQAAPGKTVLGIGYAIPYLQQFRDQGRQVMAFMPAAQGVTYWPPRQGSVTQNRQQVALVSEQQMPLADASIDLLLLVHELEHTEQIHAFLREVWRVMNPGGRLLIVVPNRTGIWARWENSPFAHGQPFSKNQLTRILRDNMFQPLQQTSALFVPPVQSRIILRLAGFWERFGGAWAETFGGVILVEAEKQVMALNPKLKTASFLRPATVGAGGLKRTR
jgi:SAM-dependent methyltransferase